MKIVLTFQVNHLLADDSHETSSLISFMSQHTKNLAIDCATVNRQLQQMHCAENEHNSHRISQDFTIFFTLCMLGKKFRRPHFAIFCLFFPENRICKLSPLELINDISEKKKKKRT